MTDFSHFQITPIEKFSYRVNLKNRIFRHNVSFTPVIMRGEPEEQAEIAGRTCDYEKGAGLL